MRPYLKGCAGLVVDGVVAGRGWVQRHADGVIYVKHCDIAGAACGLDVHCVIVGSAVNCIGSTSCHLVEIDK